MSSTAGSGFCTTFGAHVVEFTGIGVREGPELKASFERLIPSLDELDSRAPAQITGDLRKTTAYLRTYNDILKRYGYSITRLFAEGTKEENSALLDGGPDVSYGNVLDYVKANCPNVTVPE